MTEELEPSATPIQATLVPVKVWIEKDMMGTVHIKRQNEGGPAFDFIQIQYSHMHTCNAFQHGLAEQIVALLNGAALTAAQPAQATPEPVGELGASEFFAWDAEGGIAFYKTRQEAIDHAKESLNYYLDGANAHGEWDEDVEQIRWGVVMQRANAANVETNDEGESHCDYELQDVATRPVPRDAYDALERERDYWRTRARAMLDHAEGTCWYWVGDGEGHLESLVNSLPVVIRADQLRELLTRPAQGVPEGWRIARTHDGIDVHAPDGTSVYVEPKALGDRKMPEEVLHALCSDLLAAAQEKGGE